MVTGWWGLLFALVGGLAGANGTTVTAVPVRDSRIPVMVINQASAPRDVVDAAMAELTRLFASIGVEIVSIAAMPPASGAPVFFICLTGLPTFKASLSDDALGAVAAHPGERGVRAYVFYPRVVELARRQVAGVEPVLAITMTHELGHMLEPDGIHASEGIMRARWNLADLQNAAAGRLRFSAASAKRIRRTVSTLLRQSNNNQLRSFRAFDRPVLRHNPAPILAVIR